jgi:3-oxoacyl-[acyl-carrier protein] reductase
MKFIFKNQTIIITGATRGIGQQIAKDLNELNGNLILTGTDKNQIEKLNELNRSPRIKYKHLDFLDDDSTNKFLNYISRLEKIDVLINNAAINRLNSIQKSTIKDWDDMIGVNLTGAFKIIRSISPIMIKNKYGRILNVSSIFGSISKEKRVIYSATKSGLNGITKGISNDLSKHDILCNSISPGFVKTELTFKNLTKNEIVALESQIPIGRLAEPSDISKTSIYLVSNLNKYITGQNIIVDGGYTNI